MSLLPFGAAPVPDATTTVKGKIKLANDLTGTADLPALANVVAASTVGSASAIPVITYDAKGRITGTTIAVPTASTQRTFAVAMS